MKDNPFRQLIQEISPFVALILAVYLFGVNVENADLKDDIAVLEDQISEMSYQEDSDVIEEDFFSESDFKKAYAAGYGDAVFDMENGVFYDEVEAAREEGYAAGYIDGYDDCLHGIPNDYE